MSDDIESSLEFHDSDLQEIICSDSEVRFILHAYVHQSPYGQDPGYSLGFIQPVILTFEVGRVEGQIGQLPVRIYTDELMIDGHLFSDLVPLPFDSQAPVSLKLSLQWEHGDLTIHGNRMTAVTAGPAKYVEIIPFSS